jgi:hypothetical protein
VKTSNIKDIFIIAVLMFVGYKTYQIEQIQPTIVTKTEYKTVESEVIKPVTNTIFKAGRDTVIYITQLVRDTTRITDTITVKDGITVQIDTIYFDSLGYIAGTHLVAGKIDTSFYVPYLKAKEKIVKETFIKEPIRVYANIQSGKDFLAPGLTLATKDIEAGYSWDIINNRHYIKAGYRIFKLYQK